jgi:hypothetical protein
MNSGKFKQIPFQQGLSKADLRRVLKYSLSGVSSDPNYSII